MALAAEDFTNGHLEAVEIYLLLLLHVSLHRPQQYIFPEARSEEPTTLTMSAPPSPPMGRQRQRQWSCEGLQLMIIINLDQHVAVILSFSYVQHNFISPSYVCSHPSVGNIVVRSRFCVSGSVPLPKKHKRRPCTLPAAGAKQTCVLWSATSMDRLLIV